MLPIIDTHQHLWDLSLLRLPWLPGDGPLARSHVMTDYLEAVNGLNVVKTVYMEVDVAHEQRSYEAEYVVDLCQRGDNPMSAAVIGGDPAEPGFEACVRRFSISPFVKGFRRVLHGETPKGYCLRPDFVRGIRLLGELGLSFDLCLRSTDLTDGARLAELCPETRFILDHCGNADVKAKDLLQWKRDMAAIGARENVVCKVSGIIASAPPGWTAEDLEQIILHTADAFGRDRIMFASDWPVCTVTASLGQWVGALKAIVSDWPESEQRKLFHDNAVRFYGI